MENKKNSKTFTLFYFKENLPAHYTNNKKVLLIEPKRVIRTLASFGLTRTDVKVYIYLAKRGSQKGKDLCNSLKMQKQQLYPCLRSLRNKGVVTATCKRPVLFSAMPFEEVLDLFTKVNVEEAERMIQNKEELLFTWRSIIKQDFTDSC